jgi:hypothetical protein
MLEMYPFVNNVQSNLRKILQNFYANLLHK